MLFRQLTPAGKFWANYFLGIVTLLVLGIYFWLK